MNDYIQRLYSEIINKILGDEKVGKEKLLEIVSIIMSNGRLTDIIRRELSDIRYLPESGTIFEDVKRYLENE